VINFRDITERKRAEAAIAEASALLDSLLMTTLDFMYFKDLESHYVRCSEALVRHYGMQNHDGLRGKTDFDFHPEAQARVYRAEEQRLFALEAPLSTDWTKLSDPQAMSCGS